MSCYAAGAHRRVSAWGGDGLQWRRSKADLAGATCYIHMAMPSAAALVELGERYIALGLPAAARGVLTRALAADERDASAGYRLAELALARDDGGAAVAHARVVGQRAPGPAAHILLGRAQLAAGELSAARFAFARALEGARCVWSRAQAHLGMARVAAADSDRAGAGAQAMAGLDALIEELCRAPARASAPVLVGARLALLEALLAGAIGAGRDEDVGALIAAINLGDRVGDAAGEQGHLLRGLYLIARQLAGVADVSDRDIEVALERYLTGADAVLDPARLMLAERRLRRRYQDRRARALALDDLERMLEALEESPALASAPAVSDPLAPSALEESSASATTTTTTATATTPPVPPVPTVLIDFARVCVLLASAYEDEPGGGERAEALYRRASAARPGYVGAAIRLALLALARGDEAGALAAIERTLRVDTDHGLAWRIAAEVLDVSGHGLASARQLEGLLDAREPGAGVAAPATARLMAATAEAARDDLLAGMYARGHRAKNLLGIIGARARSARKLATGDLAPKLADLEAEVMALYQEWAAYLRSMRTDGPVLDVVATNALLSEVIEAATAQNAVAIELNVPVGLPELRGDRVLLREALLNIVSNAAEAAREGAGRVEVAARAMAPGATPMVEIVISDTGPGIPRTELGRVFAPGFTTKESGSGLGLAIAERVVSAHYGRILVDSEPGRGTRVVMILPCDLGGFRKLAGASGAVLPTAGQPR